MRQKYYLCHLFNQNFFLPILHICQWQKYMNLLDYQLKVKLESICAEVFLVSAMTIKCQYVTCFIQRTGIGQTLIMFGDVNHVTSKGDYWGHFKKSCILLIRLEKVTKPSLSLEQIHSQTDCVQMEEIQDHCYLPEKWLNNKDPSKAEHVIVCEVEKVPRVTYLATMLCMAELQEESHCSPKRKLLAKDHVDKPDDYWRKVWWMDETKIELIVLNEKLLCSEKRTHCILFVFSLFVFFLFIIQLTKAKKASNTSLFYSFLFYFLFIYDIIRKKNLLCAIYIYRVCVCVCVRACVCVFRCR